MPRSPRLPRVGLVTAHSDRRVWQQARALLRAGWSAEVFPARDLGTLRVPNDVPRFAARAEWAGETAHRRLRASLYALATRAGLRGVAPLYQTLRATFRPLAATYIAHHRARLLGAGYQLLIAHDLPVLPLCLSAAAESGARVIYDSHELYPDQSLLSRRASRSWSQVEERDIGRADLVVTVSQGIAEELAQRYHLPRLPFVLPNVCDYRPALPVRPALAELYRLPPGRPVVLCQGGLLPRRGLECAVEAWRFLPAPPPLLVFLGEGPMRGWMARRARRLGLAASVFVGRAVPSEGLLAYTAGADLGLIPYTPAATDSLNTYLSSPNRMFEYLMARVPVLAWSLPEIRRVLDESRTGWCREWRGPRELAGLVLEALENAAALGAEVREAAARRFSFEHYEPQWLAAVAAVREDSAAAGANRSL
jgi:glycosyltransferase involved in cell wall biosynthesis